MAYTAEQIIIKLREADQVCKQIGVTTGGERNTEGFD